MYYQQQPPQPYPPPQYAPRYSGCLKFILYLVSFGIPIAGIIIAVIFMSKGDPESSSLGKTCLIISIAAIVVGCCLGVGFGALSFFLQDGMVTY